MKGALKPTINPGDLKSFGIIAGVLLVFVIVYPLIKGIGSVANIAGDILGAPGNVLKGLRKDFNRALSDDLYKGLWKYANTNVFNPGSEADKLRMAELEFFVQDGLISRGQMDTINRQWKKPAPTSNWWSLEAKEKTTLSVGAKIGQELAVKNLNNYFSKYKK